MKSNKINLTIIIFSLIILFFSLGTLFSPKKEFNETENKLLAVKDKSFISNFIDKDGAKTYDRYINDHLIARTSLAAAKYEVLRDAGIKEINGVVKIHDKLIELFRVDDYSITNKNLEQIIRLSQLNENKSIYFMLSPTSQVNFSSEIPIYLNPSSQKQYIKYCYDYVGDYNISAIDILSEITSAKNEYVYYRTDNRWTSYGAYLAYSALGSRMNFSPLGLSNFSIENATYTFKGNLYSKTLDKSITADTMKYYYTNSSQPTTTVKVYNDKGMKEYNDIFLRKYLDEKDKYKSFAGENSYKVEIQTDIDSNKSLLIIKDSYADSMLQFFIHHYKYITVIDPFKTDFKIEDMVSIIKYNDIIYIGNVLDFSSNPM